MIYHVKPGQVSYGEAIGVILLDSEAPFIPGDVANATTYDFPVRFRRVPGLTVDRILKHDMTALRDVMAAGEELKKEGVRAITSDCGFMILYQDKLASELKIPVFLSSLLQLPFIQNIFPKDSKTGILTVDSNSLTDTILNKAGSERTDGLVIAGLQEKPFFSDAFIKEVGTLNFPEVEKEVVESAKDLQRSHPDLRAILLECSVLPPYGAAVQEATGLPVFDFVTMIRYMYHVVVKERRNGYM
ncbi:MAG: aspartate/glutamate racemase family protein [Tindallia sp. MSAO_Bac2]|nr:MAG: aspartate/glutamate racemase family protein [Tindallia sp. MSAO_Bac2]